MNKWEKWNLYNKKYIEREISVCVYIYTAGAPWGGHRAAKNMFPAAFSKSLQSAQSAAAFSKFFKSIQSAIDSHQVSQVILIDILQVWYLPFML